MNEQGFSDFKKRLIASSIAVPVVVFLIFFSPLLWVQYLVVLTVAFLAFFASREWMHLAEAKGYHLPKALFPLVMVCQVIAFYAAFTIQKPLLALLFFFFAFLALFLFHFKKTEGALSEVALCNLGLIYLAFPLGLLLAILYGIPLHQEGRWWVGYLIVVTKMTDTAAYFIGKRFGKRKFSPVISPKKTLEGAIGGFLAAVITSLLFSLFSEKNIFDLSFGTALLLGGILGVFSQVGDLSESLLKRDAKVKDSSTLPGFGGVLDTVDSLLLNIPILFFFLFLRG